ncbi:MAG TPA: ADP-ribosylglycohydrolase family protein [Candidatus Competibacteraceae bacterium]|nr:MAG: ADP-ribosylglycohydrolase family protein [Candidatus Competibacteraceae bacterium]HOB62986.1 ADP-ribosylglycohydrolase family protein [Candidatus Competibacteraceae bacterium]HQA26431.1 ADP-ribosylglycohydrolase family protein [Candidatus Competibacteraceae bacterium]HQD56299.1 ADP-ribosylglycohydrolase family protein [Candidatus Competibacteraceae bacterium]
MEKAERYKGCLLGLATGDALGTTLEFHPPGTFTPLTDMVGGGPFYLKAGQWTDDTSMALCLAESLIECRDFDPLDQLRRYLRWYHEGHLSSIGRCFDIGNTTVKALINFEKDPQPYCGSTSKWAEGNGSIMRLAPVPLFYAALPSQAIDRSGESSRTTHGARNAVDACRYMGGLIVGAIQGATKKELLSECYRPGGQRWHKADLAPAIYKIAHGSFKHRQPPEIRGSGHVVKSLEAALWAFHTSDNFKEGCLKAVNLGDDADTTGAVYGQIAGAYYGMDGIPTEWLDKISHRALIERFALQLLELAEQPA